MSRYLYALGDADNIRKRMQGYILAGNIEALGAFSSNLTMAIQEVAARANSEFNAIVIFSGGDDILFCSEVSVFSGSRLLAIMDQFLARSGATISFGIGTSTEEAFLNLARAKALGPGTLFTGRIDDANSADGGGAIPAGS